MGKIPMPRVDGMILSNLLKLCNICALRKNELIDLRIKDVLDDRKDIRDRIKVRGADEVLVEPKAAYLIEDHLAYLKHKRYRTSRLSPFFPDRKGEKYSPRKLQYDLDRFLKDNGDYEKITLEKVRQSGICNFYDDQKAMGLSAVECLRQTANFARVDTVYHVKRILTGSTQPGRRMPLFSRKLQDIEYFRSITRKNFDALHDSIENSSNLSEAEKEILKEELQNTISIKS
jgi:integrase